MCEVGGSRTVSELATSLLHNCGNAGAKARPVTVLATSLPCKPENAGKGQGWAETRPVSELAASLLDDSENAGCQSAISLAVGSRQLGRCLILLAARHQNDSLLG